MQIFLDLCLPFLTSELRLSLCRWTFVSLWGVESVERHEAIGVGLEKLLRCAEAADSIGGHEIIDSEPGHKFSFAVTTTFPLVCFDIDYATVSRAHY